MSIKVSNKTLFLAILIAILAIFFGGWYLGFTKNNKAQNVLIQEQKKEIERLVVQINDTEYYVTKVEQELATEKELRKKDILEKKELKALSLKQANEINRLSIRIDTLLEDVSHTGNIIPTDTVYVDNTPHNAILLPFSFAKTDQWLTLKGNFDKNGELGINISMDVAISAISGIDKTTKKPTLVVTTDNTYINVINIASYKTDTPKPKTWGIGVVAGYGLILNSQPEIKPFIGVGLSRNFIRF